MGFTAILKTVLGTANQPSFEPQKAQQNWSWWCHSTRNVSPLSTGPVKTLHDPAVTTNIKEESSTFKCQFSSGLPGEGRLSREQTSSAVKHTHPTDYARLQTLGRAVGVGGSPTGNQGRNHHQLNRKAGVPTGNQGISPNQLNQKASLVGLVSTKWVVDD